MTASDDFNLSFEIVLGVDDLILELLSWFGVIPVNIEVESRFFFI